MSHQEHNLYLRGFQFGFGHCLLIAAAFASVINNSAYAFDEEAITPEKISLGRPIDFGTDIAPIFRANCVACHNKAKSEGQLILEDVAAILKGGSSGEIVVPGKPDDSYLYNVAARIEESYMPPMPNSVQAKKLTPREVGLLRQWIIEGAKAGTASTASTMTWQAINTGLNAIYAVDADPFGRFVAAGRAGNVSIYDLTTRDNVASLIDPTFDSPSPQQKAHKDYVHSVAFHPDGQMLATSGYRVVKLWVRDTADAAQPALNQVGTVVKCCASLDGTLTATQSDKGEIQLKVGPNESRVLQGFAPEEWNLLGIGGTGNKWLVVSNGEGLVKLIDVASAKEVAASEAGDGKYSQAVINADKTIVALSDDGTLKRFSIDLAGKNLSTGEPIQSAKGKVRHIQLSASNLLCLIEGNTVELLKPDSLAVLKTIQTTSAIASASISPDGKRLAIVDKDGKAELWNTADGKLVATLDSDLQKNRQLLRAAADKAVRDARVNVMKGQITEAEKRVKEQQDSLKKSEEEVKKAAEAVAAAKKKAEEELPKVAAAKKASDEKPDDAALKKKLETVTAAEQKLKDAVLAAENSLKSAEKGVTLTQQAIGRAEANVAERKQRLVLAEAEQKQAVDAHNSATEAVKTLVTSSLVTFAGNALVATLDDTGTTRLWDSVDGKPMDVLPSKRGGDAKPVAVLGASDKVLVTDEKGKAFTVSVFPKWKLTGILGPAGEGQPSVFADRVLSLAFSPDGRLLAAGGGEASRSGELTIWNVAEQKLVRTIENAHSDTVYGLDFSRDGKRLASAAADKFVKVFDIESGQHVRSFEGHTHHVMDVSWNGSGTKLVSAGADNAIKVWDAESGEQSRTITTYKKQVTSLEFIGMEDEFISCSGDKRVFRHRAANGGTVREFKGCPDYVYCSATTADGTIVAAGCEDGVLRIWDGKNGKEIATFATAQ